MQASIVVQRPSILILGIQCRTSNAPEAGPHDIPRLWEQFSRENIMQKINNKVSQSVIALYCDYEGDYTQSYSLVIGCPVSSIDAVPEGMIEKVIPSGSYAAFRAIGEHPRKLIEAWEYVWQHNFPRTYTGDYEVYDESFFSQSPQEVQLFIAVDPTKIDFKKN